MDRDRRDPQTPGPPGGPASPGGPGSPASTDARLEEVRQSDLNESRINEEFVDWLKGPGTTILLGLLVALLGFVFWQRYQQDQANTRDAAWVQYAQATAVPGPELLEQVAATPEIAEIDGIGELARIRAAERYMNAVLADEQLREDLVPEGEEAPEPAPLTDELRVEYLDRADALYAEVVAVDDGTNAMTIHAWTALMGRAAVAEARGEIEAARGHYEQASERAGDWYPQLADRARRFADTAENFDEEIRLPTQAETAPATAPAAARPTPVTVDPVLESIIGADESLGDGAEADPTP